MPSETITHCTACGKELELEFPDLSPESEQYDNALEVRFDGGYGMFVDPIDEDYRAIICHECAHDLCDTVPWIGKLINPFSSHAHAAWKRDKNGQTHELDWSHHWGCDIGPRTANSQ